MTRFLSLRSGGGRRRRLPVGSIVVAFAVVALCVAAFVPRAYSGRWTSLLLILALLTLCAMVALHGSFLLRARRAHGETTRILEATEREFQSIFDSTLDAIVIFDDQGICCEANPAALNLFGVRRQEFIGHPIQKFGSAANGFDNSGGQVTGRHSGHGETHFVRQDGQPLFVEYSVRANYLPGRHVTVLRDISSRREAETALRETNERYREMASNIQEIFWMLDADTKHVISINEAFETITGRSCETLRENPTSYQELFHPEDRVRVLTRLQEASMTGQIDEEFRIIRPDRTVRWVSVRGFPVRDSAGIVRRLVGTAQDITARKSAEEQMARNLALAESASAEADAFRKTTLALTQNLRMDYVLDTLLQSLLKLIDCESARVLLVEAGTHLFLARERQHSESNRRLPKCPATLDASESRFLMQVLATEAAVLIPDTSAEGEWQSFKGYSHMRSWLCVPLTASGFMLGLLSLGDTRPLAFSVDHLRLAQSLAIPAAVAIQNARLYERAEIYGAELEQRLGDLEQTQKALRQAEESRQLFEERFTKVFHSNPIPFFITSLDEGRFIDVNDAFEYRYGYSRAALLGRTVFDVGIWNDPGERSRMLTEIREQGRVRNRVTRFRKHSGEIVETFYSADVLNLAGQPCILGVFEDISDPFAVRLPLSVKTIFGS